MQAVGGQPQPTRGRRRTPSRRGTTPGTLPGERRPPRARDRAHNENVKIGRFDDFIPRRLRKCCQLLTSSSLRGDSLVTRLYLVLDIPNGHQQLVLHFQQFDLLL